MILKFLKKLYCDLSAIIRFFWQILKEGNIRDDYRAMGSFVASVAKDIKPAYKYTKRKIFDASKISVSPLEEKPGLLPTPGNNTFDQVIFRVLAAGLIIGAAVGAAVAFYISVWFIILLNVLIFPLLYYQILNYKHGYLGERLVGEVISKIGQKKDWRDYHSVFLNEEKKGDIDHIIVCLKGVFCVETKTWRQYDHHGKMIQLQDGAIKIKKRQDNHQVVKQAKQNAFRLHEFLEKNIEQDGTEKIPFITPIIVFPHWFVEENDDDEDLFIRNHERIGELLKKMPIKKDRAVSEDMFRKICDAIEKNHRSQFSDLS